MNRLWTVALAGLTLGVVTMVGGSAAGGSLGPMAVGYGLLVVLAALYMVAGLAIRDRVWRRLRRGSVPRMPSVDRLASRRVF
jgi:hypothetical protein